MILMRRHVWKISLIVATLVAITLPCVLAQTGDAISSSELSGRIDAGNAPLILDVRTPREYEAGHIPGAVNIPHTELNGRISELESNRNEEIVVHCQSGPRAGIAQSILSRAGFMKIRELQGHMQQWKAGGYRIE